MTAGAGRAEADRRDVPWHGTVPEDRDGEPHWHPDPPETTPARTAKHELVEQVRGLIRDVALLDPEEAGADTLESLSEQARQLRGELEGLGSLERFGGAASAPTDDCALYERSPVSGRANPLAAPLRVGFEGSRIHAHAVYGAAYEGPPGFVHGGVVMAAFDDLLGVAQAASGSAGLTASMTVQLRAPTPLDTRIDYEAGVASVTDRKITAWGRSTADDEVLAEAEALFVTPSD